MCTLLENIAVLQDVLNKYIVVEYLLRFILFIHIEFFGVSGICLINL